MDANSEKFLLILKAAMGCGKYAPGEELPLENWQKILQLAQIHNVLPMVVEAVWHLPELKAAPFMMPYKQQVMQAVVLQDRKTDEFLKLYDRLRRAGATPLVVKGIICRNLYPQPDHRLSGDEDVLIPPEQFPLCHRVMTESGMSTTEPEEYFDNSYEIPYGKQGGALYIELHKHLFPPESEAYGDLNRFFEGIFDRAVEETIQGTPVASMAPTDHMFYLICHAFKHFLHSGFGIRQVCDIVMYADRYGAQMDWASVQENCRQIRAEKFTAAMFRIGEKYLGFPCPGGWQQVEVDEQPMLEDLLQSGVFGDADMSRKHSSNITLTAVVNQKQGRSTGGVLRSLFPPSQKLQDRYPFLKKHPALLPVAWASRIVSYGRETAKSSNNNAADSIRIGTRRVTLMRQYDILD